MEQNNNTNNQQIENNPSAGEKTFSQEDVNRIVSSRLAQEKAKSEATLAEREKQLEKREKIISLKEKIKEMNIPIELLDVLDVSNDEALDKALNAVKDAIGSGSENNKKTFIPVAGNRLPESHLNPLDNEKRELRKTMGLPVK